jgi:hypothetical protein
MGSAGASAAFSEAALYVLVRRGEQWWLGRRPKHADARFVRLTSMSDLFPAIKLKVRVSF